MVSIKIPQTRIRETLKTVGINKVNRDAIKMLNYVYVIICLSILKYAPNPSSGRITPDSVYRYLRRSRFNIRRSKHFAKECQSFQDIKTPAYYERKLEYYASVRRCTFIKEQTFRNLLLGMRKQFVFKTDFSDAAVVMLHKGTEVIFKSFVRVLVKTLMTVSSKKILSLVIVDDAWKAFVQMRGVAKVSADKQEKLIAILGLQKPINVIRAKVVKSVKKEKPVKASKSDTKKDQQSFLSLMFTNNQNDDTVQDKSWTFACLTGSPRNS